MRFSFSAFTIMMLLQFFDGSIQAQKDVWNFGNGLGIDFYDISDVRIGTSAIPIMSECAVTVFDSLTEEVLFYTDGSSIWDKNDQFIIDGEDLGGNFSTSQSTAVIQHPGIEDSYYIFSLEDIGSSEGNLYYTLVSTTNSEIEVLEKKVFVHSNLTEKMIGVKGSCNTAWIVVHERNSNRFISFEITPFGIVNPVYSEVGATAREIVNDYDTESSYHGKIRGSWDNSKILNASGNGPIELFEFNNTTGIISNQRILQSRSLTQGFRSSYSSCFSPDNSKIYVFETQFSGTRQITQYDVTLGTSEEIQGSRENIFTSRLITDTPISDLQVDPFGRVLISGLDKFSISIITNPNEDAQAIDFIEDFISFAPKETLFLGFHEYPILGVPLVFEELITEDTLTFCEGDILHTLLQDTFSSYKWSDGSTGVDVFSPINDSYYWVEVKTHDGCVIQDTFVANQANIISTFIEEELCDGDTIELAGKRYFKEGEYIDTLISSKGCDSILNISLERILPIIGDTTYLELEFGTTIFYNGIEYSTAGLYESRHILMNSCDSIEIISVSFNKDLPTPSTRIAVANIFTPNNDGINDTWNITIDESQGLQMNSLSIFDRWGNQVFHKAGSEIEWKGEIGSNEAQAGVYFYKFIYVDPDGKERVQGGDVSLVR